jgi:hypothetical protein
MTVAAKRTTVHATINDDAIMPNGREVILKRKAQDD